MDGIDWLVESVSRRYLKEAASSDLETVIERDRPAFDELASSLYVLGSDEWREERGRRRDELVECKVPQPIAQTAACHKELTYAPDVIAAARATGRPLAQAANTLFRLGERLHIDWLEEQIEAIEASLDMAELGCQRTVGRAARAAPQSDRARARRGSRRRRGGVGRTLCCRTRDRDRAPRAADRVAARRTDTRPGGRDGRGEAGPGRALVAVPGSRSEVKGPVPGSRCEARVPGSVSARCSNVSSARTGGARHGFAEPGTAAGLRLRFLAHVRDDVLHGQAEGALDPADEVATQPARLALRVGRDHDPVGVEAA